MIGSFPWHRWRVELLLIRHALPERVERVKGVANPVLSPEGRDQATRLARSLRGQAITAVVSSPLRRAVQTAEQLAADRSLPVEVRPELAEFDQHSSWYVPMEELRAAGDPRWDDIMAGRWEAFGVDFDEFRRAAVIALESLVADHPGGTVAAITHGGVINAYVSHVVESRKPGIFQPGYTSVSRILAARSGERTIGSLNDTRHLHVQVG